MTRPTMAALALLMAHCGSSGIVEKERSERAPAVAEVTSQVSLPSGTEQQLAEWLRAASSVTVQVLRLSNGGVEGWGSGVIVSANGAVITAAHVVEGEGNSLRVVFPDGNRVPARIVRVDRARDLALLSTAVTGQPCVAPRRGAVSRGDWLACVGYAGEAARRTEPARSIGPVLDARYDWARALPVGRHRLGRWPRVPTETFSRMVLVDFAGGPGMSGGPVLDANGALVGVIIAQHVVTPLVAASDIASGANCESPLAIAPPVAIETLVDDEHHQPDRARSLRADAEPGSAAAVITLRGLYPNVYVAGVVAAPDLVITVNDSELATRELEIVDRPDLHPQFLRASGELALLSIPGLGLAPVATATAPQLGMIVANNEHDAGVVGAVGIRPGRLIPYVPWIEGMCGTHNMSRRHASPEVELGVVFAHDAPSVRRGALLVDRAGHPVGIHVASYSPGVGYAVAWADARARFGLR